MTILNHHNCFYHLTYWKHGYFLEEDIFGGYFCLIVFLIWCDNARIGTSANWKYRSIIIILKFSINWQNWNIIHCFGPRLLNNPLVNVHLKNKTPKRMTRKISQIKLDYIFEYMLLKKIPMSSNVWGLRKHSGWKFVTHTTSLRDNNK